MTKAKNDTPVIDVCH